MGLVALGNARVAPSIGVVVRRALRRGSIALHHGHGMAPTSEEQRGRKPHEATACNHHSRHRRRPYDAAEVPANQMPRAGLVMDRSMRWQF
jgi:hypothetical protein